MQEKIVGVVKMKKKINRNFIFPIILFFFFILFFFNDTGIIKWYHLRKERNQIKPGSQSRETPLALVSLS